MIVPPSTVSLGDQAVRINDLSLCTLMTIYGDVTYDELSSEILRKYEPSFHLHISIKWLYRLHKVCCPVAINVVNSSPLGRDHCHFAANNSKCIFMNEKFCILIRISQFCSYDNKPAFIQVMAWRRTGDKPLPEAILTQFTDAYMQH